MTQASKYQYQRRLGGGGMAEVFLASTVGAEGFSRPVAIKRVLPSFSEDSNFATMFVNEARLSSILRHPNIVQVLDFDRDGESRLFLVMELVEGKDLSDLAHTGPLPIPVVVHVMSEVLKGLAHAHEMMTPEGKPLGIVHRDISPHNVLVSWDGAVKVSDFGIAKAMLASGAGRSGMIKGKPLYMAPEQVLDPDNLDHRADLFAVGVMLFELLTGQRIYKGHSHEEVLTDVIQVAKGWRQLVAPTTLRPDLPWDVAQVAMMLLAPDRQHRFASARDAIDALLHTSSASPRGGELLAELMYQRFPSDAPPRAARRNSGASGVVAGPEGATWVVTPAPIAGGTPRTPSIQAQMGADTRTVQPGPTAQTRPLGPVAASPTTSVPAAPRSRVPMIIAVIALVAVAVVVTVLVTRGGSSKAAAAPRDAASLKVDAAAATAAPSDAAAVAPPDASRTPVDATPPPIDAAPPQKVDAGHHKKPRDPGKGTGTGTGSSTIHDIPIGE